MSKFRFIAATTIILSFALLLPESYAVPSSGKILYNATCFACHGTRGKGTADAPSIRKKSLTKFKTAIRKGHADFPAVPVYPTALIKKIYNYVRG